MSDAGSTVRTTAQWMAVGEERVGGEYRVLFADHFALATDIINFAGELTERICDEPGEPRAFHVGLIILARLITELRACVHLVGLGYPAQAVTLVGTMLELMHVGAYIGADEARADAWLAWDNPKRAYPGRIDDTIKAVAERFGIPTDAHDREYQGIYREVCMVKHANPLSASGANLAIGDAVVCVVAGPVRTMAHARLANVAIDWATRYALLGATVFIADHLTDLQARPLMDTLNGLRERQSRLAAASIQVFEKAEPQ